MKIEDAIRQRKFESSIHKSVINLVYTHNWLQDAQQTIFDTYQLTPQQYNVLRILRGRYPNSASVGEVKEVMLDKNPDLTRLCDRLLKKKLIVRELNEFNRRQILIRITKEGLELLKEIDPSMKKHAKSFNLTEKEAELLSGLLDKMRG